MQREKNYEIFFGLLANRFKQRIIAELMRREQNVNELSHNLKAERSKVSHALLVLEKCRVVDARKEGKFRIYALNSETIVPLLRLVDKHVGKYCEKCNYK